MRGVFIEAAPGAWRGELGQPITQHARAPASHIRMVSEADVGAGRVLIDYLDRAYLIHLPQRRDRFGAIERELSRIGIPVDHPRFSLPVAPVVDDPDGFHSVGVKGNFLSHLDILHDAAARGHEAIMVLEDDAMFAAALRSRAVQRDLVSALKASDWGLCFLGHPLRAELQSYDRGLVTYSKPFKWTHCYIVHRHTFAPLTDYLEATMRRPTGHPDGGRMFIDGAFSMFRNRHPEVRTLVANPALSIQRGSPSSLAQRRAFDRWPSLTIPVAAARRVRDEFWRWSVRSFA